MRSSLVHERARFGASSNEKLRTPKLCPTEMNLHQKAFRYAFDGDPTFRDLERRALMRELQHHHLTPEHKKTEASNRQQPPSRLSKMRLGLFNAIVHFCHSPVGQPDERQGTDGTDRDGELPPPADE